MKQLLSIGMCLAMVMSFQASAQDKGKKADNTDKAQSHQQQGQQQTIRGTVAGVTTLGEAAIDPEDGVAVSVETDYLTVLGSPVNHQGNRATAAASNTRKSSDSDQQNHGKTQADQGRQNLYLVAISPETKIRMGGQKAGGNKNAAKTGKNDQNQSALMQLEIGDRVTVQFQHTGQMNASKDKNSDSQKTAQNKNPKERVAGYRGKVGSNKHGRDRIFIGEASTITIMPMKADHQSSDKATTKKETSK